MIQERLVHEIHASELRAFLECRLAWHWAFTEQWVPNKRPEPLEFGAAWHTGLEALYDPALWENSTKNELYARARSAFEAAVASQVTAYLQRIEQYTLSPQDQIEIDKRLALGRNMLSNLVRKLDKERYRPIAAEEEYEAPILDSGKRPIYCKCDACWRKVTEFCCREDLPQVFRPDWIGLQAYFRCRIDALFEDRVGSLWAVDH